MLLWGFQKQWVAPRITQPKRERILESPNSLVLLMVKLRLNVFFKSRAKTRNEVSSILVQSFLWYIFLFISFRANTRGPRIHNDTEKCLQTEWIFYVCVSSSPNIRRCYCDSNVPWTIQQLTEHLYEQRPYDKAQAFMKFIFWWSENENKLFNK